jgi:hypothetical protein
MKFVLYCVKKTVFTVLRVNFLEMFVNVRPGSYCWSGGGSTVVRQLTHDRKFKGLNPPAAGIKRGRERERKKERENSKESDLGQIPISKDFKLPSLKKSYQKFCHKLPII